HPVHVTLRAECSLPSLRGDRLFPLLRRGFAQSSRGGLRILHFSVQTDHVHLIVEAESGEALSRGLQGLAILAKRVNRALDRAGSFWSDRYHARPLRIRVRCETLSSMSCRRAETHARFPWS